jgi:hypothetical protein
LEGRPKDPLKHHRLHQVVFDFFLNAFMGIHG